MALGDGRGDGGDAHTLLRVVACGSVDDGKSTLIGRLLHDTRSLLEDTLAGVERSSRARGTELDLSLVTDGLEAERAAGITIDVAYRTFQTPQRTFVLADAPGHVQYTRNMVTAASTADVAVLLVDVTRGVTEQTRRHAAVLSAVGVDSVIVAVNKMDAVDWSQAAYEPVRLEVLALVRGLGFPRHTIVPISALTGANVVSRVPAQPAYLGPTLLRALEESVPRSPRDADGPLRLPVQWVCRPRVPTDPSLRDYRGLMGRIERGRLRAGDVVVALPSGTRSTVTAVERAGTLVDEVSAGEPVTVRLRDELDISRGDVLVATADPPPSRTKLHARLCWMGREPLVQGHTLSLRVGATECRATVTAIDGRLDLASCKRVEAEQLAPNDIGWVELRTTRPVFLDEFSTCRATGAFILVDPVDFDTLGACCLEA